MTAAFDSLADLYDLLTDWEKRLPREVGFLADLLAAHGCRTVLDAACGTGMHLVALAERGFEVRGSDLSPEMVVRARERSPSAEIAVADFAEVGRIFPPQDAVIVVGNSLPNAGTPEQVRASLDGLAGVLRPGGLLVLHMLNFAKLTKSGGGLRPHRQVRDGDRELLFLKLFEVHEKKVVLDVIALELSGGEVRERLLRSDLCPIGADRLAADLEGCGLDIVDTWGGFDGSPFYEADSGDLIVAALKRASTATPVAARP